MPFLISIYETTLRDLILNPHFINSKTESPKAYLCTGCVYRVECLVWDYPAGRYTDKSQIKQSKSKAVKPNHCESLIFISSEDAHSEKPSTKNSNCMDELFNFAAGCLK